MEDLSGRHWGNSSWVRANLEFGASELTAITCRKTETRGATKDLEGINKMEYGDNQKEKKIGVCCYLDARLIKTSAAWCSLGGRLRKNTNWRFPKGREDRPTTDVGKFT